MLGVPKYKVLLRSHDEKWAEEGVDVLMKPYISQPNGKITLERYTPYLYTGVGILIE